MTPFFKVMEVTKAILYHVPILAVMGLPVEKGFPFRSVTALPTPCELSGNAARQLRNAALFSLRSFLEDGFLCFTFSYAFSFDHEMH